MKNVTRTIITTVARYIDASGEHRVRRFNTMEPYIVKALTEEGAKDLEVGYVSCLYSMSVERFMEEGECLTDLATAELYATADDCPTRADRAN